MSPERLEKQQVVLIHHADEIALRCRNGHVERMHLASAVFLQPHRLQGSVVGRYQNDRHKQWYLRLIDSFRAAEVAEIVSTTC